MYTIVGFKRNTGKLENGTEWENFSLFCTKEDASVDGVSVETVRVKPQVLRDAFPTSKDVLGSRVSFAMECRHYNGAPKIIVTQIIKL